MAKTGLVIVALYSLKSLPKDSLILLCNTQITLPAYL